MLTRWLVRLRALFRREDVEAEFDEELRFHLEQETERNLARGMSPEEARRAARRAFGDPGRLKEEARETWRWRWLDDLTQDVRYGARGLRRSPGFTAVAVLSLGFGIGAVSTLFAVIDALDFRPLPYADAERLVWLGEVLPPDDRSCPGCPFVTRTSVAGQWRAQARSYEEVGFWSRSGAHSVDGDVVEPVTVGHASPGFFRILGVRPVLGREFAPDDTLGGAGAVALLSHRTWRERFGGDPAVLGGQIDYHGDAALTEAMAATVVGVLPDGFRFGREAAFWIPFSGGGGATASRSNVLARLRPGVTRSAAEAELGALALRAAEGDADRPPGVAVLPLRERLGWGAGEGRGVLFGVTGLVLLIAVMNVAGLSLARALSRRVELTVRSALGAERLRLVRQLLVEGTLLGVIGGAAGALLATWGVRAARVGFRFDRAAISLEIDHRIVAFGAAASVLVGILTALLPALRTAGGDLHVSLRERQGSGPPHRAASVTGALLMAQVALGLVLLTGAGLLGSEFLKLRYLDLGFDPTGLYEAYLFGAPELRAAPEGWRPTLEDVRARARGVSGVTAVALRHNSAVEPSVVRADGGAPARPGERTPIVKAVDREYFETLGIPSLRGRAFTALDREGERPVAVLNRAAAGHFWPGEDALGRQVFLGDSAGAGEWLTVVGVVADVERAELVERHWPIVYRPLAQAPLYHPAAKLFVRLASPPDVALLALQAAVRRALGHPTSAFRPTEQVLGERFLVQRFNALALNLFAAFALLLSAMGIYGSVAYAVSRRTREIGIRVALGAEKRRVLVLVARHAAGVTTAGVALGVAGSLALARVLRAFVSTTSVTNPWTFAGAALVVAAVALLAAYLPARRAVAVDPVIALRSD